MTSYCSNSPNKQHLTVPIPPEGDGVPQKQCTYCGMIVRG